MRIHHLNCITMCPPGGRRMDGQRTRRGPAQLSCHCLLVEAGSRLVLVDTGFGLEDVRRPRQRLSPFFLDGMGRPRLKEEDTAVRQLQRMGAQPEDVTDIVLTHLDFDHAGGLDDFPRARVHLLAAEARAAVAQRTPLDRRRFRPQQWQASVRRWNPYPVSSGEPWFGFEAVRDLEGLPPDILLVPLTGHTLGHAGVAVRQDGGWLLHAGDAYFFRDEKDPDHPRCTPGLAFYQRLMEKDRPMRLHNQHRLRELVRQHGSEVQVFCAHDLVELEQLRAAAEGRERAPALRLVEGAGEAPASSPAR
jgi:glyoxylase-like metal-dependent hydrolase (beta-lactamase superfamily II)